MYHYPTEQLINAIELVAKRLQKQGKDPQISSIIKEHGDMSGSMADGNFTVVFVTSGNRTFMGVAKRNPGDDRRPEVGLAVACRRLVTSSCEGGK